MSRPKGQRASSLPSTQIKPVAWVACLLLTTVVGSPANANEAVVSHDESGALALGAKVSQAVRQVKFTCDIEGLRSLRQAAQAEQRVRCIPG